MEEPLATPPTSSDASRWRQSLYAAYETPRGEKIWVFFVLFNLLIVLTRPQNDITVLAQIQFPFIVSLFPFAGWLTKLRGPWTKQMIAMTAFAVEGAIWVPLALNNRYAFEAWRTLVQIFLGVAFPLTVFLISGKSLRRFVSLFICCGFYVAVYGLTHGGRGPGDYLGDENDFCLMMVMYLPFVLFALQRKGNAAFRFFAFLTLLSVVGAIVASFSRGGFLGFAAVLCFILLTSPKRFTLAFVLVLIIPLALLFAPAKYIDRISTITHTTEGSALERRETWRFAWDIFIQPKNIIAGVGMKNTPIHLGEYKTSESRNLWGRQAHSIYFELLPDLGLIGLAIFLYLSGSSFLGNRRLAKDLRSAANRLGIKGSDALSIVIVEEQMENQHISMALRGEMLSLEQFLRAINAAWIGVLVAGAFISIFYYPIVWVLAAISGAAQIYAVRLINTVKTPSYTPIQGIL